MGIEYIIVYRYIRRTCDNIDTCMLNTLMIFGYCIPCMHSVPLIISELKITLIYQVLTNVIMYVC